MDCFDDFITIKATCGSTVPKSGFYIDRDGGISLKEASDIVTSDYSSAEEFLNAKISTAINLVSQNIYQHFSGKIKSNSLIENENIGFPANDKVEVPALAGYHKGISLDLDNNNSFVSIFISRIAIFSKYTGDVSVKIYDVIQDKVLDTITVSAVSGEIIYANVQKSYFSNRRKLQLAFLYDSTGIISYQTYCNQNYISGCVNCSGNSNYSNRYVYARPVKIPNASAVINANLQGGNDTGGLIIQYSINCDYKAWLCSISNIIAIPVLYKACEEVMNFAIENSDRNNYKTFDMDKLKERRLNYENKFNTSLENIINNMKLPSDRICFQCNTPTKNIIVLP